MFSPGRHVASINGLTHCDEGIDCRTERYLQRNPMARNDVRAEDDAVFRPRKRARLIRLDLVF